MTNKLLAAALIGMCGVGATIVAQEPASTAKSEAGKPAGVTDGPSTATRIQVTLSRFQGDKKISSLPYSLSVVIGGPPVRFRIGAQVPYPANPGNDKVASYNYRDVGVGIDVSRQSMVSPGLYTMQLEVDDSTLSSSTQIQGAPAISNVPVFRTFRTGGTVFLRDGQTTQLTSAADPITGETMRVDVTLAVVK